MGTTIRNKISKQNPYWMEPHRYQELKHFCLQYESWRRAYLDLTSLKAKPDYLVRNPYSHGDPTEKAAMHAIIYSDKMEMVNKAAERTDDVIGRYILEGVTTGSSYDTINARHRIPCSKKVYYTLYRKFFYILDKLRQ